MSGLLKFLKIIQDLPNKIWGMLRKIRLSRQSPMQTILLNSTLKELLTRIIGQEVNLSSLSLMELFTTNLAQLLLGVASADKVVTLEERKHLRDTLIRLRLLEGEFAEFTRTVANGINKLRSFSSLQNFLTLATPLNSAQRLLLIGLGYEMSAADGTIDPKELAYLQRIASALEIKSQYLSVLEASFTAQKVTDFVALEEVRSLLDPARFHDLDIIFTDAASHLVEALPRQEGGVTGQSSARTYEELNRFQQSIEQLNQAYAQVDQVIRECVAQNYVSETLVQDFYQLWERLSSQKFRVAVVGEFSQGKSTFLNALLGEEIQPTRAIPCSGTVTILRYGKQKRVICRYRDGKEEEIPIEQYQDKAAISKEAAYGKDSARMAMLENEIDEIIFEHPDLELCKSGVEIVDSPGLNEHDERTRITQQLLKGTDAVIFLANAQRPLTQWEQDFLKHDLRQQMRSINARESVSPQSTEETPAENLFVLVNFMDLLRKESDREDVRERLQNFLLGTSPILAGENRIHYISAQETLEARLTNEENRYTHSFQEFVRSLEQFLTADRGKIKINQSIRALSDIIEMRLKPELKQARAFLNNEISLSENSTQAISTLIEKANQQLQELRKTADSLQEEVYQRVDASLGEWMSRLDVKLRRESAGWSFGKSTDKKAINRHFSDLFIRTVSEDLERWAEQEMVRISGNNLKHLEQESKSVLQDIYDGFRTIDSEIGSNFSYQFEQSSSFRAELAGFSSCFGEAEEDWKEGLFGFTGLGALGAGLVAMFMGAFGPAMALFAVGQGFLDMIFGQKPEEVQAEQKEEILQKGIAQLRNSLPKIREQIRQRIGEAFGERRKTVQQQITSVISSAKNLLRQEEISHQHSEKNRQEKIAWLDYQSTLLEQAKSQSVSQSQT
ncbi:dynamin family protein [Leptolyngbya sp. NIES-3755]|nr:dynamin family protein [Leptolyngbya sp. NIES-3755]